MCFISLRMLFATQYKNWADKELRAHVGLIAVVKRLTHLFVNLLFQ